MSIDPRLIERRRTVAEDKAKRNVGRLLKFLVALVAVAALVWLLFSPWLSVNQVDTTGVGASTANSILVDMEVAAGTPMININEAATEAALLEDPWIATAAVARHWPNRITVDIVERTPVAWAQTASGWSRRALDGVALSSATEPDDDLAQIDMSELVEVAATSTPDMLGALEFIDALPADRHPGAVVTRHDGELWANVAGFQVRLGRAVDMRQKARSLQALLDEPIPVGSILILIAPTNPSVMTPSTSGEADDERTTSSTVSGDETGSDDDAPSPAGEESGEDS